MPDTPDYRACYANCLGDCSGPMSQEHLVSGCLYEKGVKVKGLPWCKDDWKVLSVENLTSKTLCRHHNSALSDLDDVSKAALNTIAEAFELWGVRKKVVVRHWTKRYFTVNLLLLERWCLKSLINVHMNQGAPAPSRELVRLAFGLEKFKPPMGLYMIVPDPVESQTINIIDGEITIQPNTANDILSGAQFSLWGLRFLLNLFPEPIKMSGARLMGRGGMQHWFQMHDDKRRVVKSHLLTYVYE